MKKRILIFLALLANVFSQVYSSSLLKFKYEYPLRERVDVVYGYEFCLALHGLTEKDGVYSIRIEDDDSCVAILIQEANLLERADVVPENFVGLNVCMQLLLKKKLYGYDILNFAEVKDGYLIELNGKLMCESLKWNRFIKELIEYHQKHKKITHELLKEILCKSGMMK